MSLPKKEKTSFKAFRNGLMYSIIGFGLVAYAIAPRKVTIPAFSKGTSSSGEGVVLFNGSPTPVTYKVTCYDKAGTTMFGPTTHTVNSKASKVHGADPTCRNGGWLTTRSTWLNGMVQCGHSETPSPSKCPVNYHLCSFAEMKANTGSDNTQAMGWTSDFSFTVSSSWSVGYTTNSSTSFAEYSGDYRPIAVADANSTCYAGASGGGASQAYCGSTWSTNWQNNFCCPDPGADRPSQSCDVEIIDPTAPAGFLQSPQFKGNSPF